MGSKKQVIYTSSDDDKSFKLDKSPSIGELKPKIDVSAQGIHADISLSGKAADPSVKIPKIGGHKSSSSSSSSEDDGNGNRIKKPRVKVDAGAKAGGDGKGFGLKMPKFGMGGGGGDSSSSSEDDGHGNRVKKVKGVKVTASISSPTTNVKANVTPPSVSAKMDAKAGKLLYCFFNIFFELILENRTENAKVWRKEWIFFLF